MFLLSKRLFFSVLYVAPPVLAPLVISPSTTPIRRSNVSITARLGRPAFPYPVFSWTFNDTVLIASSRHAFQMNGTVLTIYGVSVNDTGRYTVSATNAVATVTTYIDVLVYGEQEIWSDSHSHFVFDFQSEYVNHDI